MVCLLRLIGVRTVGLRVCIKQLYQLSNLYGFLRRKHQSTTNSIVRLQNLEFRFYFLRFGIRTFGLWLLCRSGKRNHFTYFHCAFRKTHCVHCRRDSRVVQRSDDDNCLLIELQAQDHCSNSESVSHIVLQTWTGSVSSHFLALTIHSVSSCKCIRRIPAGFLSPMRRLRSLKSWWPTKCS